MAELTSADAFALGDDFRDAAIALGAWRVDNRLQLDADEWDRLDERQVALLNAAADLYTRAVGLRLDESAVALEQLRHEVRQAQSAIRRIRTGQQALRLAAGLLLLAGAIMAGRVGGVGAALKETRGAVKAIREEKGT